MRIRTKHLSTPAAGWIGLAIVAGASGASAAAVAPPTRPAGPAAPATAATRPAAPDLSSPKAAARAYADVVFGTGDPKMIRAVTAGDERTYEQAEAAAAHAAAMYDLASAAAERFGEEGRDYANDRAADRTHFLNLLDRARVSIDEDTAYVFDPESNRAWRISLRKVGGGWRVELPNALLDKDEHAKAVRWMNAQARLLRELAADVRAGRYKSVQEVERARREKVSQAGATMLKEPQAAGGGQESQQRQQRRTGK